MAEAPADTPVGWTWPRLARVAAVTLAALIATDAALAPLERRIDARAARGSLRNAPGIAAADGSRRMMLDSPESVRRGAVGIAGSSITYGSGVADDETVPAQTAVRLRDGGDQRAVFNLSQGGGGPRDVIPVAAAMGTHPLRMLMVEFQPHNFVRGLPYAADEVGQDEVPMLLAASDAQRPMLAAAGMLPDFPRRVEDVLSGVATRYWRAYRIRGHLWVDDQFQPMHVAWTLRRGAAAAGVLPRRFQGQSTNIGRLPWRIAYRGQQVPSALQQMRVPTAEVSEQAYAPLRLLSRLARAANVPLVFYESPLNLPFQREFHMMSEEEIARLAEFRVRLAARMRADGMTVLDAPEMPDDGYLDRAHLTPLGCRVMAEHLSRYLLTGAP